MKRPYRADDFIWDFQNIGAQNDSWTCGYRAFKGLVSENLAEFPDSETINKSTRL